MGRVSDNANPWPPISAERWKIFEPLLDAALDTPSERRNAWLAQACRGDEQLLAEVVQLLDEYTRPDAELDSGAQAVFPYQIEAPGRGASQVSEGASSGLDDSEAHYGSADTSASPGMSDLQASLRSALAGRYAISREVGHGGMAVVFLATDLRQHRQVAIKVLRPDVSLAAGTARFVREIEIAGKLTHPHILALYEAGEADGLAYFVMPFVAESLRDRLRRETQLPVAEALRITREVGDALAHAHQQGFIHRDIKPENILLAAGHALVADFGIARAIDSAEVRKLTQTGMAVGTPHYMSPEAVTASDKLDGKTDQYALACVLYEMLTGGPPFSGPNAQVLLARHLLDPVPPVHSVRPSVSEAVDDVLRRALAKLPADRYVTVTEFVEALGVAHTTGERSGLRRRTHLRWWAAAAAVVLVVSGVTYVVARRSALEPTARDRVLVSVYENKTGDAALNTVGDIVADYLTRGLAETGLVEVLDARAEAGTAATAPGAAGVRALGRTTKATQVVWGSYYRLADSLRFETKITDVRTGKDFRPVPPVTGSATAPSLGAERLSQRVMASFAASRDSTFVHYDLVSQPRRYDAYTFYRAGVAARLQTTYGSSRTCDSCAAEALANFDRALALDPQFVTAAIGSVAVLVEADRCPAAESLSTRLRATPVAPLDGANLDFHIAGCRNDWESALEAARRRDRLAPNNTGYLLAYAANAMTRDRPAEVLRVLGRIPRSASDSLGGVFARLKVAALHRLGDHKQGLDVIRQTRPPSREEDPAWYRVEMRELAALGRVEELTRLIDERASVTSANTIWDAGADMLNAAPELRVHGHPVEAKAVFTRAVAWYHERQSPPTRASRANWVGFANALYGAERWDEAWDAYTVALTVTDSAQGGAWIGLGATAARRGDRAMAAQVAQWLERNNAAPGGLFMRARLAAVLGDKARAVDLLRQLTNRSGGFGGMHVEKDFDSLRGYKPFDDLLLIKG